MFVTQIKGYAIYKFIIVQYFFVSSSGVEMLQGFSTSLELTIGLFYNYEWYKYKWWLV